MQTSNFKDISYLLDDDGIVTLTFNTPKRKNALSMASFYELYLAVDTFEKDDSARAMIITGAPDPDSNDRKQAYSSGGYFNADALEGFDDEVLAGIDPNDIAQKRTTLKLFQCDKPILAAVNGLAIGGAVTVTLAGADQIYMSEHAWFQLPFAKLGICAELASSFLLPRIVGLQKAKEIMFFAEPIDAQEAKRLGLVSDVLPHNELLSHVRKKALQLIPPNGAPLSIQAMKKLIREPLVDQVSSALDRENAAIGKLFGTQDFTEALIARQERRAPKFTGD